MMLKTYWTHEIARWNKHPYMYTAITAFYVGWIANEILRGLEDLAYESIDKMD